VDPTSTAGSLGDQLTCAAVLTLLWTLELGKLKLALIGLKQAWICCGSTIYFSVDMETFACEAGLISQP